MNGRRCVPRSGGMICSWSVAPPKNWLYSLILVYRTALCGSNGGSPFGVSRGGVTGDVLATSLGKVPGCSGSRLI